MTRILFLKKLTIDEGREMNLVFNKRFIQVEVPVPEAENSNEIITTRKSFTQSHVPVTIVAPGMERIRFPELGLNLKDGMTVYVLNTHINTLEGVKGDKPVNFIELESIIAADEGEATNV